MAEELRITSITVRLMGNEGTKTLTGNCAYNMPWLERVGFARFWNDSETWVVPADSIAEVTMATTPRTNERGTTK